MEIRLKKLHEDAIVPEYKTNGSSGMDLCTYGDIIVEAGATALIRTGIALEIPQGFEAQVRSRSSMAQRGLIVANSPGTIDSDYRGELMVLLLNTGTYDRMCTAGTRIAQMVFAPVQYVRFEVTEELNETERGEGGFGSTGT